MTSIFCYRSIVKPKYKLTNLNSNIKKMVETGVEAHAVFTRRMISRLSSLDLINKSIIVFVNCLFYLPDILLKGKLNFVEITFCYFTSSQWLSSVIRFVGITLSLFLRQYKMTNQMSLIICFSLLIDINFSAMTAFALNPRLVY